MTPSGWRASSVRLKTLAALNQPNIAQIHGFERTGGIGALVMELVEGPTLADRIAQGSILVDEALPIVHQFAEALEAAHEQNIIHRDLKPANVKLRLDGTVKVLDFGLAKVMEPAPAIRDEVTMRSIPDSADSRSAPRRPPTTPDESRTVNETAAAQSRDPCDV
jgi:serine/threonine protein kinase